MWNLSGNCHLTFNVYSCKICFSVEKIASLFSMSIDGGI